LEHGPGLLPLSIPDPKVPGQNWLQARTGCRPGLVSENWETNTPNDRETNGDQKIHGKYLKPQFNIQD